MSHQSATAVAHPNLALIKYWGKRDDALVLPWTGSLSLTLDVFPTRTTVAPDPRLAQDEFRLNGMLQEGVPAQRVREFLDLVRERSGSTVPARIDSENSVPTGAGLASSASGFAALARAASVAYGLPEDPVSVSRLARRGSGSAARSVLGNLVVWHPGEGTGEQGDLTSYAEEVPGPELGMVVAVVSARAKAVSSRVAMRETVRTSPYFPGWVESTTADLEAMRAALAEGRVQEAGELTESNALRMHAAIMANRPPVRYLTPVSVAIFDAVADLRAEGLPAWGTADAGPNVAVLAPVERLDAVHAALARRFPELDLIRTGPGPGAHLVDPAEPASGSAAVGTEAAEAEA